MYKCAGRFRINIETDEPVCTYQADRMWHGRCPACKQLYSCDRFGSYMKDGLEIATLGGPSAKSSRKYISTGQPGFDHVCGGGLVAGRVVLLGGYAGTGKTRLLLIIADYLAKTQGYVIYASGEESTSDLNSIGESLGLVNDRVIVLGNQSAVEDVIEYAKTFKAFLIVLDSAQVFTSNESGGGMPGSQSQCKAIGKVIKEYCNITKTCAIVVNQMAKDGDLKGGTELEHRCDVINVLGYPQKDDKDAPGFEEDHYRVLINANKNRCGIANRISYWRMTDAGVLEHVAMKSKIFSKHRKN